MYNECIHRETLKLYISLKFLYFVSDGMLTNSTLENGPSISLVDEEWSTKFSFEQ